MGGTSISSNLVSVLLLTAVLWRTSHAADKCTIACSGSPTTESFLNGHKYNYGVEGTVNIYVTGADKQETSVKLLGQVSVTALGNCAHELTVQNLVISGPNGKKYQSPPGINKPVRFSYQDGRVGPEICAEEQDTRRSLNIKRAIISLLQTEQKPSTQVDVFGVCPTEVSFSQEGAAVLVHRSRDLSRCAHREQGRNDLITAVYNPTAEIKETQVLRSTLNVESKVVGGVPEKVSANEEYLYKPFSVGENGARASVHTKLTLAGKSSGGSTSHCTEPRTIIFENPHGTSVNNANAVIAAIRETANAVANSAGPKSAGDFAQLIRIMRSTSKDDLMRVFTQVKNKDLERRVYLDGLLRAGTGYSIDTSVQILKNKELGPIEQQLVYLSLGNAKHVNNEALKSVASLLDIPNIPKEIYLGVGAMAGTYCREHSCHSTRNDGVFALSQKLANKLHNCRPRNKVEEDNVVAVLKGIRNIRHLEDCLIEKLYKCVSDQNVKARVKVAALEAFHADPCSDKIHKLAMETMKNRNLDSEIRIKAYLAVIQCPCAHSASEIKNLLESEPVHQVGNFISSSLRHIRASANPDKALARQHYGQIRTPFKFNMDESSYSTYREMSFNVDALGMGGNIENTVIYSQDSFLPRSVDFNLTTEIFGHNFNLLEFGGRQGNLDRVLEHFLGPKGVFRTSKPQEVYDNIYQQFMDTKKKVEESISRRRRSVKGDIDNFDKNLKAESIPYNNELDLDIYLKIFGTDAVFLSLGDDKGFNFNKILDQLLRSCTGGINSLKNLQQDLRAHILFLDAELSYPTSTGLPLRLDLIGSATARLNVATDIDVRQIIQNPQNTKIDIKFVPSSAVEITGQFLVDADAVATGLKVITNVHSSTGVRVIAKILDNGKGFDLEIGMPVDKQEILTANNEIVYFTAEKGQLEKHLKLKIDGDRKDYSACFDQLSQVLGITLCGEVKAPFSVSGTDAQASISSYFARYPLAGALSVKLVLEKNDLNNYHIKGLLHSENNGKRGFELLFEAQGSKNRRTQLSGDIVYNNEEASLQIGLESPIKTISFQVGGYSKPNELIGLFKAKLDDSDYYAKIGFNVQGNEARSIYKPILEYKIPDESKNMHEIKIDGQLVRECSGPQTKYTLEGIVVKMPSNENLELSGFVSTQSQTREVNFNVAAKNYAYIRGFLKGYDLNLEFNNELNPFINFILKGHFENTENMHNEFELSYGGDCQDPNSKVIFYQILKSHTKSPQDYNVIVKNKFEIRAIPFKIRLDADVDPKKVDIDLEGTYDKKSAQFDLEARTDTKKPGDYSVKLIATVDQSGFEVFAKRDIADADKSNLENYIEVKNVGKYELSGVCYHKNKANDIKYGFVGYLKVTDARKHHEETKFDVVYSENTNLYSSHAKITQPKGEQLLNYALTLHKGANANGQLELKIKNIIDATGQYKSTDADGKSNANVIVDFKQSHRKIKADMNFVTKDQIFNADIDIYLNFEKDSNDKLHFTTNNKHTDKLLDSKSKIEYGGKKTSFVIRQDGFNLVGKTHTNVEFVLPTERCINFKLNRDITENGGVYNGNVDLTFSDSPKKGQGGSTITYNAKAIDSNFDKEIINYEGNLELKLKDGKELKNHFSIKNVPEGDKYKFDFKTDFDGNMLPKPASLLVSNVGTDSLADDSYRLKANYGESVVLEIAGARIIKLFGETGDKKYQEDYTVTLRVPSDKYHDLKYVGNILYLKPEGKDTAEYTLVQMFQVNSNVYKVETNGKVGLGDGYGVIKLLVPHMEPVILDVKYKNHREGDRNKVFVDLKAKYDKGKSANAVIENDYSPHENNIKVKINAPHNEKLKQLEFSLDSKNPAPESYSNSIIIQADGRVYKTDASIVLSKAHPVLDISYTSPSSDKVRRLYVKGSSLSSTQGKIEIKIDNVYDICLDAVCETNIQKDNVAFHFQANSEKLGLNNYVVDISSKDGGSGKRLEFSAVNDNKNVLSGSTSFISKQEGQKTIIEGSGSVKVKEAQKSANFKYIRTVLNGNNEKGIETFFNLAIGERSYVAESRVTNLEYKNSYVYCEEKKQCAHAEIQSKTDNSKAGTIQNVINVGFDLRKLGITPEFGLQIKNTLSDKQLPQYQMDVHINKDDKKYHLQVFDTPEFGTLKSGVLLHLPSRVVSLEYVLTYPTDKVLPLTLNGGITLNMDKNKPGQKFAIRYLLDVNMDDNKKSAKAEVGFHHPSIEKEAVFRFNGVAVNLEQGSFKFESTGTLSHPCFGSDRVSKVLFEVSQTNLKFLIVAPFGNIIDVEGSAAVSDNKQQASFKFGLLEVQPIKIDAELDNYKRFEITAQELNHKLFICGNIDPEKKVDFSADMFIGGDKKNLVHAAVYFKNNELKEDYNIDKDNYKLFYNILKKDLETMSERIQRSGKKASEDYEQFLSHAKPTAQRLSDAFSTELKKFFDEIVNDKGLLEISHAFQDILKYLAKIVDDVSIALKPLIENIQNTYTETAEKIFDLYTEKIKPQINQLIETLSIALREYLNGVIEIVAHFTALAEEFFNKYSGELKQLTEILTNIFKDVAKIIVAMTKEFRERIIQVYNDVSQQIKDLPILTAIKEKYQELGVPEQVKTLLETLGNNIKVFAPTPESKKFLEVLQAYIQKKLNNQQCDDNKELREIYQKLVSAIASLVQFFNSQLSSYGMQSTTPITFGSLLFSPEALQSPPSLGEVSFSLIKQFLNGDLPDPMTLIRYYRKRLNPLEGFPPQLRAVVVNGQHIFTFDGRHLTFPGNCRYILAHDYVDRNFTLAIHLQNGQPTGLLLEDQSGAVIELKSNGQATLNDAAHGLPVLGKDTYAFKRPNGRLGLYSKYGLLAECSPKLEVCYVEVSGYYFGKLRGLLGDGNNEPYDDFRLPNGKICSSESEFGNAYRVTRSCHAAQVPEHSHHQLQAPLPPACQQVFGGTSSLHPATLLTDFAPFRQACIHAVAKAEDPHRQACDLGCGFAVLALRSFIPAFLPVDCLQCTDADKPRNIGETFELKLPNKQADIIVVVETMQYNEKTFNDLVVPLVSQLVESLKSKQITDIKVFLAGVTSKHPYPLIYDTDLKLNLKNTKIEFNDLHRYEETPSIDFGIEKLDNIEKKVVDIINNVKYGLELTNVEVAYTSLFDLPVRPSAIKHAITVVGEKCKDSFFLLEAFKTGFFSGVFENMAFDISMVSVTDGMTVGAGKKPGLVVGYTEHSVLMLGEKKLKDSDNIRPTLKIEPDSCRDFVEGSEGIVLSGTNFAALANGQKKQYIQTAASAIAQRMTATQRVQQCTCAYKDPCTARSVCVTKDKKELARKRK